MVGLREAGVLCGSVILAGGVAYFIWKYASYSGKKNEAEVRKREDGEERREVEEKEKEETKEERREEEATAEESLSSVEAPKTSESRPVESGGGTHILVLGLDGAGKTSLLHRLAGSSLEQDLKPTEGFNAVSINRDDFHTEFLEIGGREDLRPYWIRYISKALLLVFVVDSSNPELFPVAKKHLHELLASRPNLPLMVLANKQDLPGSCGITDLHDALSLSDIGERRLFLIGTHVKKGEVDLSSGVQDAQELIIQMVCEGR